MIRTIQLRRFFSVLLLTVVLLVGSTIGSINSQAFAASDVTNDVSNVKGESKDINGSYRRLRVAAHDFRNQVRDEQKPFNNKSKAQPGKAIKDASKNTKNVFQKTVDSVKEGLSSD